MTLRQAYLYDKRTLSKYTPRGRGWLGNGKRGEEWERKRKVGERVKQETIPQLQLLARVSYKSVKLKTHSQREVNLSKSQGNLC